jgi:crotonobetaine/carnitine-CoA ligase
MAPADVFSLFAQRVDDHPEREFLRRPSGTVSYSEAADAVDAHARALAAVGLEAGDVVALFLENSPEFIYTVLGAARLGVTAACVNTEMRGRGIEHLLNQAGATTIVSTDEYLTEVAADLNETLVDRRLTITDEPTHESIAALSSEGTLPPRKDRAGDLAALLHTSGTTGLPKWCELSHEYFLRLGTYVADRFEIAPTDVVFNPLPLYHINPLGYYFFGGLTSGATLGLVARFSVSQFWEQVRTLGATVVILHMAPKDMILSRTTAADAGGHDIRVMFPADRAFMRRFEIPKMLTGYGSTEAGGLTHTNKFTHIPESLPDEEDLSQFAGEPRADVSIRIVDEDGDPVDGTRQGEILVRPEAHGVIFDGYHAEPERTVEAWDGLWFNTGDLGYRDEDGLLHFVGRIKDSISHKGQFVNVDLVEAELESHSAVEQAVVVGIPDDVVGERVKATIVPHSDVEPEELLKSVEPHLPSFMVPEYLEFVDAFPRIEGTEKINRSEIAERGVNGAWHRET